MKYRRLTNEELAELEKEFIRFLVSNTVTGDDWEKIKTDDPKKAEGLIEIFSDIVFDKTIEKIEYLEFKIAHDIKIFHCRKEEIEMMGLRVDGKTELDFTKNTNPQAMLQMMKLSGANLQLYNAQKKYKDNDRAQELFRMMQGGALISDGKFYQILKEMQPG